MEQYVKGFQRFHAGEDVRPVTSCKFLLIIIIIIIIIIIVVVVVVGDDTDYWVYLSSDHLFQVYYKVRQVLLQSATAFFYYKVRWSVVTKCDSFFITKCDKCYYKVRQVLLQSATGITKCDNFITKCDRYYKVRRLLQSATVQWALVSAPPPRSRFLHLHPK